MNKDLMRQAGFGEHVDRYEAGRCSWCNSNVSVIDFKDDLSRQEYIISGLCQKCQDDTFKDDDESSIQ